MDKFPAGIAERIKWYVYRLIDPRNGETFYIGKGKGDRVFDHSKAALAVGANEDAVDLKFQRIKDIWAAGLEVAHVIHRHNIETETIAFQIEAALIDAYPGLTNRVGGHGSDEFGVRHVDEIVKDYRAEPFIPHEPLILINITQSYKEDGLSIYNAVRGCWRIDPKKAAASKLILAHRRGLVVGAFRPIGGWIPATTADFPWLGDSMSNRYGFVGEPAESETWTEYVGKRVPDEYRVKGAANPIRFVKQAPFSHPRWSTGPEGVVPLGKVLKTIYHTISEQEANPTKAEGTQAEMQRIKK
jgi:hypothetical protein